MKVLLILAAVALAFFLLSLVRVGGELELAECGLRLRARVGGLWLTLYPMKPREKKKKKKTKPPPPPPKPVPEKTEKKADIWPLIQEFLPVLSDAAGRMKRKIQVDRLDMDLTVAAENPAFAAVAFGAANAAIGMMIPVLEHNFKIRERKLNTRCDFTRKSTEVKLWAAFSLTIGQGAALAFHLGKRALGAYLHMRKEKQKEAV